MSGLATAMRQGSAGMRGATSRFWTGVTAVAVKELRGRMRGRRAFAVVTIYLLLLSVLAFGVYYYLRQQALLNPDGSGVFPGMPRGPDFGWGVAGTGTALSASIGHGIFGSLLAIETLLILVLAPAFTAGAISMEREKQTIDMLIATPLSTLGMVLGKLISALAYVFLLILASIPLASLVFVFGAVGPEDLVRGYVFLFALAFGMGAIGMFISALVRRTQTATVLTYVTVLVLSVATAGAFAFWSVAGRPASTGGLIVTQRAAQVPEALLWLNPFAANMDLVCMTAPDAYHEACKGMAFVTGRPYFGSSVTVGTDELPRAAPPPELRIGGGGVVCDASGECKPIDVDDVEPAPAAEATFSLGFPRDTFWPKSAAAFFGLGVVLTFLSAQLVAPSRRLRLRLPRPTLRRAKATNADIEPDADVQPAPAEPETDE